MNLIRLIVAQQGQKKTCLGSKHKDRNSWVFSEKRKRKKQIIWHWTEYFISIFVIIVLLCFVFILFTFFVNWEIAGWLYADGYYPV